MSDNQEEDSPWYGLANLIWILVLSGLLNTGER